MSYLRFLWANWRLLGFGFVLSFGSSFGQTFYISLSSADIRGEFGLSHGEFGTAFTIATLASGACLVWAGRQIDRVDLRLFTLIVVATLIGAMVALSLATSLAALIVILFLLRFCGQGLMIHTASTTMARYFDRDRGKALSVGLLGQPFGEAVLPALVIAVIVALGWRDAWLTTAAAMAVMSLALLPLLLRGHGTRHREFLARVTGGAGDGDKLPPTRRHWTRAEVLRDSRFFIVSSIVLAFPFIGTGLFFHQVHIAESQGWALELLAIAFVGFAIMRVIASLLFGPMIDRFGATRLVVVPLVPLVVTLVVIIQSQAGWVPFVYLGALGVSVGTLIPLLGALWSELYGTLHLGAIKALSTAIVVLGSATSPAIFGVLLDAGISIEHICAGCLAYVVLSGVAVASRIRPGMVEIERVS